MNLATSCREVIEGEKMNKYAENIYIENTKCFRIEEKSLTCYEVYSFNPLVENGFLIGSFKTYKEALNEIDTRLGKRRKKIKL